MSEKRTRTIRPVEERIAEIDKKIAAHQAAIDQLQKKRETALNPKRGGNKKIGVATLKTIMKENGLTCEDVVNLIVNNSTIEK